LSFIFENNDKLLLISLTLIIDSVNGTSSALLVQKHYQQTEEATNSLNKSIDCFIQRKEYKYYTAGVVNTILLSLDKKMAIANINAEFMVRSAKYSLLMGLSQDRLQTVF